MSEAEKQPDPSHTESVEKSALPAALAALALEMREDRHAKLVARKRENRWLWIRRLFYVGLFFGFMLFLGQLLGPMQPMHPTHIARIDVSGMIVNDPQRMALLKHIADDPQAEALVVRINSPGGTTVGGEALYHGLRAVAEQKPVVAVMGEVGASAAYMTALGADHIIARGNTITASIGVIMTAPNFHEALDRIGIQVLEMKSGERKATPSPFQPLDSTKLAHERELIDEIFEWFVGLVQERRQLSPEVLTLVRDGRIVTGRRALSLGLIDEIGSEEEALQWLTQTHNLVEGLPVVDRYVPAENQDLLSTLLDTFFGTGSLANSLQDSLRGPVFLSQMR